LRGWPPVSTTCRSGGGWVVGGRRAGWRLGGWAVAGWVEGWLKRAQQRPRRRRRSEQAG
jgi:hypothetical protein